MAQKHFLGPLCIEETPVEGTFTLYSNKVVFQHETKILILSKYRKIPYFQL